MAMSRAMGLWEVSVYRLSDGQYLVQEHRDTAPADSHLQFTLTVAGCECDPRPWPNGSTLDHYPHCPAMVKSSNRVVED